MGIEWEVTSPVRTDSGMFAVWQPEAFASVTDIDTWEDKVGEDPALEAHIESGVFVPVNIGSDGAFGFTVRVGTGDLLTARERACVAVTSAPYRLAAQGHVVLSGLESIGLDPGEAVPVETRPGAWAVTVHLIDWESEPGAADESGNPTDSALSDFVIELRPAEGRQVFRQSLETFERPSGES